jgi:hypothetical protein
MSKVLITQSNYIPWKGYFDNINSVDKFIIYDDMQYTRRDWRNRNRIKTSEGLKWLTIPVKVKGKYFQKINEVETSNDNWRSKHWKVICHNYSRAKYFQKYKELFEPIYLDNNEKKLSYINYKFIEAICHILEIKTEIFWSDNFALGNGRTERLLDLCQKVKGTHYLSGPRAKSYLNEFLFEKAGIQVGYFDYTGYTEYYQLNGKFYHDVSIIDLLFNEGPDAKKYMKSFKNI